eukprot:TRINITY_DN758_c0_g1_i3.p1 TRINITY_DN758_c0_g1~~TRINITY_DN758_c0_g1_i3.p1  ORF type:complete len:158 (-),score=25.46 TRINITY_DN758_c0_g1_i3:529-1002(-)
MSVYGACKVGKDQIIVLWAAQGKKDRYFLPSQQNDICGVPIPHLLVDTGCSSILLPVANLNELQSILDTFKHCILSLHPGGGIAALPTLVLRVTAPKHQSLPLVLCQDLGGVTFDIPYVRYHLSLEDANYLSQLKDLKSIFEDKSLKVFSHDIPPEE